jgi:hypothetical protein
MTVAHVSNVIWYKIAVAYAGLPRGMRQPDTNN